ncbi:MAG: oligosaccharide flippase family protein [Pseudomonadota bacterium]
MQLITSLAWSTAFRLVGVGSAFLVNVVLARLLSPDSLGQYLIGFSLVMFVAIFMRFGVKQTAMKLAAEARNSGDEDLLNSTVFSLLIYALTATLTVAVFLLAGLADWIFLRFFDSPQLADAKFWFVLWCAFIALAAPVGEALRGLHRPGWGVALDMSAQSTLVLGAATALLFSGAQISLEAILKVWCAVSFCVLLAGFFRLSSLASVRPPVGSRTVAFRDVFHSAWPVFALNVSRYLTANAALWIVGNVLGHSDAALYGVAVKIYNLLAVPLLLVELGLGPHIADYLHRQQSEYLEALLRVSALAAFSLTLFTALLLVFFGESLLVLAFGDYYSGAHQVLLILVLGNVVNVLTGSCSTVLLLAGVQRRLALINSLSALLGIGLSLVLVPQMGILGAGVSTVLAVALANGVMWISVREYLGINTGISLTLKPHYLLLKTRGSSL